MGGVAKAMNSLASAVSAREAEVENLACVARLTGLPNRGLLRRIARDGYGRLSHVSADGRGALAALPVGSPPEDQPEGAVRCASGNTRRAVTRRQYLPWQPTWPQRCKESTASPSKKNGVELASTAIDKLPARRCVRCHQV